MAYSTNVLPKAAAYYSLNNASISNGELTIEAGGFAEIQVSSQMLPKLTASMLVVVHPSKFSNAYTNDAVQVTLSIVTSEGKRIEYLIPAVYDPSGVFNTVVTLPEETFASFIYRISSKVPVSIYNWELCSEEAVDVTDIIGGVEQALPRLLYDYNTYAYAVAQKELTVGLISCYLKSPTDLQGHFTLSFFATEKCNVHVRIKDNGVTELFSPQVYTVEKGYASISIPHAYLHKTATDHIFSVTIQCTNGQLSLPVRGLLYTIDGGYLATRLLDAGIDIEDLSIRQLPSDASPSEIWAIGFEGNRLLLKSNEYTHARDMLWTAVKDFGEGLHAAVEFRGSWTLRSGSEKYTLETEETPYVFIVDTEGILKVYSGADFNEVEELAVNVTGISACQGFNSLYYSEHDHGTIIAYIKDGNVLYRSFIYNTGDNAYGWDSANTVYSGGDAKFVSVHRLPDYRVGICITHSTGTKWYITGRNYVGQSVKPEMVYSPVHTLGIATVIDSGMEPSTSLWVAEQNVFDDSATYHNGFVMTFDGTLTFLQGNDKDTLLKSIVAYVNDRMLSTDEIKFVDITKHAIRVELTNSVRGGSKVRIEYNCPPLALTIYNGCYAAIQQNYSWDLPLPVTRLVANEELMKTNISPSVKVDIGQILPTGLSTEPESCKASVEASFEASIQEVVTRTLPMVTEDEECAITSSVTISVQQTGTSPI